MIRRQPRSTRTYTLCPYTTLFRSCRGRVGLIAFVDTDGLLVQRISPDQLGPKRTSETTGKRKVRQDTRERTDAPAVNPETARSLLHATGATRRLLRHEHRGVALAFPHDLHAVTAQIEHRGRHRAAGTTVDHDVDGMVEQRAIIIRAADRFFLAGKLQRA